MVAHLPIFTLLLVAVGAQMALAQVPAEYQVILDKHNAYRAKHGVPALVWDAGLQADAQAYADTCPAGHSQDRKGAGENLWAGIGYSKEACNSQLSDDYYNEVSGYNYDDPGSSKGATGHFTQLVWKDTQKIGCAIQMSCGSALGMNQDAGRKVAISVCRYSPPGNVQVSGDTYKLYKEQVLRPGSAATATSTPPPPTPSNPPTPAPTPTTTTNSNRRVAAPKTPPADPPAAPVNPPPTPPPAAPVTPPAEPVNPPPTPPPAAPVTPPAEPVNPPTTPPPAEPVNPPTTTPPAEPVTPTATNPPVEPVNPTPATPPPAEPVVTAAVVPDTPAPKSAPPAKKGKKSKKSKKNWRSRHWKWVLVSTKDDTEVYELKYKP